MASGSQNLQGKRVLVTRSHTEDIPCPLSQALSARGADVVSLPMVSIEPVDFPPPPIEGVDWLFFTSPNAVRFFCDKIQTQGRLPMLGAVGDATALALRGFGLTADFVSPVFEAVEAAKAFTSANVIQSRQILWPCGNLANAALEEVLTTAGARVTPFVVYHTTPRQAFTADETRRLSPPPDVVAFTSPSAVAGWVNTKTPLPEKTVIACIGPTTAEAAKRLLGRADIVAGPHTMDALASAIEGHFMAKSRQ